MGLLAYLVVMVASWVPLFLIPFATGGWFLMAVLSGALTGFLGWGLVSMQALFDGGSTLSYVLWWVVAIALAVGGVGLFGYGLAMLIWRGAGLHIDVSVTR